MVIMDEKDLEGGGGARSFGTGLSSSTEPQSSQGLGPSGFDPSREVAQWARDTQRAAAAGERDLRELGKAMNGRWDQDFPAAALAMLASHGGTNG